MAKRILVVDDERILLKNLVTTLRRSGYEALGAETIATARGILEAQSLNLLCLDIGLTDGDGLDFLQEIRIRNPGLSVIVMTGQDSSINRNRAENLDATAFLTKPFSLPRFKEIVRCVAGEPRQSGQGPANSRGTIRGPAPLSVMMYSHDSIGLGHVRRNANIATRLVQENPNVNVLMLVGSPAGVFFDLPSGVDFIKLPSVVKVESDKWESGKLRINRDQARDLRANLILRAVELFKPRFFLVDHVPTGVWGELLPTLEMLRNDPSGPKAVLGLRDILDKPEILRRRWLQDGAYDVIAKYYDRVFLYGSRRIFDAEREYALDEHLPGKAYFCGYLSAEEKPRDPAWVRQKHGLPQAPLLLVTGGGGRDAYPMMSACLDALECLPAAIRPQAIFLTGMLMAPDLRRDLEQRAEGKGVEVLKNVAESLSYINAADLVLTMGGYNTLVECIRLAKPLIVVPRMGPSKEQKTRARIFHELGLVQAIYQEDATADRLAAAIAGKLSAKSNVPRMLGPNGVAEAARQILDELEQNRPSDMPARLAGGGAL